MSENRSPYDSIPSMADTKLVTYSQSNFVPVAGTSSGGNSFRTLKRLIESTTYKPGYQLHLRVPERTVIQGLTMDGMPGDAPVGYAILAIECMLPDSTRPPHELRHIVFQTHIGAMVEEAPLSYQKHLLKEILRTFEEHEIDEWFKIDGKLVHNPHAKER